MEIILLAFLIFHSIQYYVRQLKNVYFRNLKMIWATKEKNILSWGILNFFICRQIITTCDVFTDRYVNNLNRTRENVYIFLKRLEIFWRRGIIVPILIRLSWMFLVHIFSSFYPLLNMCTWMFQRDSNSPCPNLNWDSVKRNPFPNHCFFFLKDDCIHLFSQALNLGITSDFRGINMLWLSLLRLP